jgi:hypothetical protein
MGNYGALTMIWITKRAVTILACAAIGIPPTASTLFGRSFFFEGSKMKKSTGKNVLAATLVLALSHGFATFVRADDLIEKEGVGVGVTAGNFVFLPAKFASVTIGLFAGAASWILTGGNTDLTKQIWQDTTQGPYLITPELAKKGIGERPLLAEKNQVVEKNQAAENPTAGQ